MKLLVSLIFIFASSAPLVARASLPTADSLLVIHGGVLVDARAIVSELGPEVATVLEDHSGRARVDRLVIVCAASVRDALSLKLRDLPNVRVEEIDLSKPSVDFELFQANALPRAIQILSGSGSFAEKRGVISGLLRKNALGPAVTEKERDGIAFATARFIHESNLLFTQVFDSIHYESRMAVFRESPGHAENDALYARARKLLDVHPIYLKIGQPLRDAQAAAMSLMHLLNTPESRRSLLALAEKGRGAGLPLMKKGYLSDWLGGIKAMIAEAAQLDFNLSDAERTEAGWTFVQRTGGVFERLGVHGALTLWRKSEDPLLAGRPIESLTANPLVLLGNAKSATGASSLILQFIRDTDPLIADQVARESAGRQFESFFGRLELPSEVRAQALEFWKTDDMSGNAMRALKDHVSDLKYVTVSDIKDHMARSKEDVMNGRGRKTAVTGNYLLDHFLRQLVWAGGGFADAPGFSLATYYASVADIFVEMVENSAAIFKNNGTYLSVLDAALELHQHIEVRFGTAPRKNRMLLDKSARLTAAIQGKLLSAARKLQFTDPDACAVLLSAY